VHRLSKLPDNDLEPVNLERRSQDEHEVGIQAEVVLDERIDEVSVGVLFAIEDNVGPEFSNAQRSLAPLLTSSGRPGAVWTFGLTS
jgi:hypothetical protein